MALKAYWEPLAELLHYSAQHFVTGEKVSLIFVGWDNYFLGHHPQLILSRGDLLLASGQVLKQYQIRISGPQPRPNLINPLKPAFSAEAERTHLIEGISPSDLLATINSALTELIETYDLGINSKFFVEYQTLFEEKVWESEAFAHTDNWLHGPMRPSLKKRIPKIRVEIEP
jgi:hypothetical protein